MRGKAEAAASYRVRRGEQRLLGTDLSGPRSPADAREDVPHFQTLLMSPLQRHLQMFHKCSHGGGHIGRAWLYGEIYNMRALAILVSEELRARPLQRYWSSGWGEGPWPSVLRGRHLLLFPGPTTQLPRTRQSWLRRVYIWGFKSVSYSGCYSFTSAMVLLESGLNRKLSEATTGVEVEARREALGENPAWKACLNAEGRGFHLIGSAQGARYGPWREGASAP